MGRASNGTLHDRLQLPQFHHYRRRRRVLVSADRWRLERLEISDERILMDAVINTRLLTVPNIVAIGAIVIFWSVMGYSINRILAGG
jgi:hypothetical protein